jgi:hypothetical protein
MTKNFITFMLVVICALVMYSCKEDSTPSTPGGPVTTTNHPPDTARNPNPPDQAVNVPSGNVPLSWTCTDPDQGDTLTYDIYVVHTLPLDTLVAQNHQSTNFTLNVPSGVTRYWKIVSKDNHGASTPGREWRFRTQ